LTVIFRHCPGQGNVSLARELSQWELFDQQRLRLATAALRQLSGCTAALL